MSISFSREPAVWIAVIKSAIYAAVLFGLQWTPAQVAGVIVVCEAVGATVQRSNSFAPVSKGGEKLVAVKYEGGQVQTVVDGKLA